MSTPADLIKTAQREKSGSRSIDRFDAQICWGVGHLIGLHEGGKDYAVGFEFHDDIVELDDPFAPKKIRFFQVKTRKKGNWTIKRLTDQEGKEPSIIGKLFDNKVRFPEHTDRLGFVSNQPPDFLDVEQMPASLSAAEAEKLTAFGERLKAQNPAATDADLALFHFYKTDFTLDGYEAWLKGRIVDLVSVHTPNPTANLTALYLAMVDQCRKRSKHLRDCSSLDDLLKSKFVCRADVTGWLQEFVASTQKLPDWSKVLPDLDTLSATERRSLHQQWERYSVDRFKTGDAAYLRFRDTVRNAVDAFSDNTASVLSMTDSICLELKPIVQKLIPAIEENYVRAAILYEYSMP